VRVLRLLVPAVIAASLLPGAVARADTTTDPATTPPATTPTTTDAPAPTLPDAAIPTAIDVERVARKIESVERDEAVAQARAVSAQAALSDAEQKLAANEAQIAQVQSRVKAQALVAYEHTSSAQEAVTSIGAVQDLGAGSHYAQAALGVDDTQLAQLNSAEQGLAQTRDDAAAAGSHWSAEATALQTEHQELVDRRTQEQAQLDSWGAVPVMGDTWLTAAQLAAWFHSTGAQAQLAPGTTIEDLARLYVVEGTAEHVRGDLAFAQAVIETGSFAVAAGNNYSGIGVCDSCTGGYAFPTPLDGVRAQIQLLRNYADPDSRAADLANPPSPALYGSDPRHAAATYDSFFLKGKAPLWNQMGNGNWATDPTYAQKVVRLFAQMTAFAAAHPSS